MSRSDTIGEMLKKRMEATGQASKLEGGNEAYEKIFQPKAPEKQPVIHSIPMDKLVSFFRRISGLSHTNR